jgi:hypothetical protein
MKPRKLTVGLLGVVLCALTCLAGPAKAWAGGPTSVLLVSPERQRATALYHTDARYERLVEALQAYADGPGGSVHAPASVSLGSPDDVRLTWMIHDMAVWRVDRIHHTASDGIWVQTLTVDPDRSSDVFSRPGHWQRPANSADLAGVFIALDMLDAYRPRTLRFGLVN